jgi:hypothetical protein
MSSEMMRQIVEMIESEAHSRPSPIEFEMAYQARVAMDRIRFAIKHAERFSKPCHQMREASLQLLEALDRLECLDRRFQARSRIKPESQSVNSAPLQDVVNGQ